MSRKIPKTISETEFLEVIKKVKNNKSKLAFMLGFYQGLRVSEVINLKPENIDKERGFIHIIAGKGNKDRDIPIMPPVESGLKHLPMEIGIRGLQKQFKRYFKFHPGMSFHSL